MTRPDDETRIIEIYSAANEVEAGAIRAALEDAGIRARIVGNLLGNATGEVPLGFRSDPKIWVREEDAVAARDVILQLQDQMGDEYDDPNGEVEGFDAVGGSDPGDPGDA